MKKILVVTGTRADYGQLRLLIKGINDSKNLQLILVATGSHLSKKFGNTYKSIEEDGFHINYKINILGSSDTSKYLTKALGNLIGKLANIFNKESPELVLILGDRYEMLAAAVSSLMARIPIAHIHGGEITEGAIDDSIRHSISKMSHLHFVAHKEYQKRVMQLGEDKKNIHIVGGLGVDCISKTKLLSRQDLESALGWKFGEKNILVTFHPVTLENMTSKKQIMELLSALAELKNTHIIFTMPNADPDSLIITFKIQQFVEKYKNAELYPSLGQVKYLSTINQVDCVIGNSSSGLCEVPSFKKPTVNIGDRQKGRVKAESVIDCEPNKLDILKAINKAYSKNFQKGLKCVKNPYGNGNASKKILKCLEKKINHLTLKKSFIDT